MQASSCPKVAVAGHVNGGITVLHRDALNGHFCRHRLESVGRHIDLGQIDRIVLFERFSISAEWPATPSAYAASATEAPRQGIMASPKRKEVLPVRLAALLQEGGAVRGPRSVPHPEGF